MFRNLNHIFLGSLIVLSFSLFQYISTPTAEAGTITVGGACGIVEAFQVAQDDIDGANCTDVGGGLDDIIELETGVTYTLTAIDNMTDGNNGLPSIDDNVTVNGNGSTIDGAASNDPCDVAGTEFRIFHVAGTGDLTLNDLTVSNGCASAAGGGSSGGGIRNEIGMLVINNSTISGNSAIFGGGGIFNFFGTVEINNSTISGNSVGSLGGGIFTREGTVEINNSTISGNSGVRGGGIHRLGKTRVEIINSIVANQVLGFDCSGGLTVTSLGHNLDSDGTCFPGAVTGDKPSTDPLLGPLADNGGPTDTHALLPGSPAIDMGDPAGCFDTDGALLTTDQRGPGFPRTIDGDGNGSEICDIGAYEFEPLLPEPPSGPIAIIPTIIPTLGQWGMIFATLILGFFAVIALRRRIKS